MENENKKRELPPLHAECDICDEVTFLGDMSWRGELRVCEACK